VSGPNAPPQQGQQDYRTPPDFLAAALRRFQLARWDWDLACEEHNCVAAHGFKQPHVNALAVDWSPLARAGATCWLNPDFGKCRLWAPKCASSGVRIVSLMPASVGSVWFRENCDGKAQVIFLQPRIVFLLPDGTPCEAGINRDCMLVAWGWAPGYSCEDWCKW
jgi:hypothetical protein